MIVRSPALRALEGAGYDTIAISSGFASVDLDSVDRLVSPPQPTELEVILLRSTITGLVLDRRFPDLLAGLQRDRIRATVQALADVARPRGAPQFVFAHVPAPHGPWVIRGDGSVQQTGLGAFYTDTPVHAGLDRNEAIRRSFAQTRAVAGLAIEVVDRILARDDRDQVIVVFSDHGPGFDLDLQKPMLGVAERSSNLLAVKMSGRPSGFTDGTTPVNVFPYLLNAYLGTKFPTRPDVTFVWHAGSETTDVVQVPEFALD